MSPGGPRLSKKSSKNKEGPQALVYKGLCTTRARKVAQLAKSDQNEPEIIQSPKNDQNDKWVPSFSKMVKMAKGHPDSPKWPFTTKPSPLRPGWLALAGCSRLARSGRDQRARASQPGPNGSGKGWTKWPCEPRPGQYWGEFGTPGFSFDTVIAIKTIA